MHDVQQPIPTRYPGIVVLFEEYHWTWRDVQEAPADLIDELLTRIYAKRKWEGEKEAFEKARKQARLKASGNRRTRH